MQFRNFPEESKRNNYFTYPFSLPREFPLRWILNCSTFIYMSIGISVVLFSVVVSFDHRLFSELCNKRQKRLEENEKRRTSSSQSPKLWLVYQRLIIFLISRSLNLCASYEQFVPRFISQILFKIIAKSSIYLFFIALCNYLNVAKGTELNSTTMFNNFLNLLSLFKTYLYI